MTSSSSAGPPASSESELQHFSHQHEQLSEEVRILKEEVNELKRLNNELSQKLSDVVDDISKIKNKDNNNCNSSSSTTVTVEELYPVPVVADANLVATDDDDEKDLKKKTKDLQLQNQKEGKKPMRSESNRRIISSSAIRPKVVGASPELIELHNPSHFETSCEYDKTITFKFDQGQPNHTLQLRMKCSGPGGMELFKASIDTDTYNGKICGRWDYFIHMNFMKDLQPIGVHKWFQFSTGIPGGRCKSNFGQHLKSSGTGIVDSSGFFLTDAEFSKVRKVYSNSNEEPIMISVKMIVKYYDVKVENTNCALTIIQRPKSRKERLDKLLKLKGQLFNEVTLKAGGKNLNEISVIIHEKLLSDCSPVFESIFNSYEKPGEEMSIKNHHVHHHHHHHHQSKEILAPSLSFKAMSLFYNWIYGVDSGEILDDIPVNLELLEFAEDYMIEDLIQICTDNLIRTPDTVYTMELVIKIWKIGDTFAIPGLEDRVLEWIDRQSSSCDL